MFYFHLSSLRLLLRNSKLRWIASVVGLVQNIVIPSLLVWVLNAFSTHSTPSTWTHRIMIIPWEWTLTKTTPLFTLIEGFASLLVIQAVGQICRWVVNNRSDSWMVLVR
jgi:ICE2